MSDKVIDIDQELLTRIKKSDRIALTQLFDKYYPKHYKFAFSISQSKEMSDEAVADVFIHLWLSKSKLNVRKLSPYLFTIARNNILVALKKQNQHVEWLDSLQYDSQILLIENVDENDKLTKAKQILNRMPKQCRVVFELHKLNGFKYAEIAEILQISTKTVENHMSKALKIIHQNIKVSTYPVNIKKTNS
ncbi:MAG: RNA polymerase sigma factor [Cyclobacteriaceae bacterium]